jgi:hypothetical protein
MTLYLLKVQLQNFLSIPITQKCQIFSASMCSELILVHEIFLFFSQQLLNHCIVVITCCVFWYVMYPTKP